MSALLDREFRGISPFVHHQLIPSQVSGTKYSNRTVTFVAIWWRHSCITGTLLNDVKTKDSKLPSFSGDASGSWGKWAESCIESSVANFSRVRVSGYHGVVLTPLQRAFDVSLGFQSC